MPHAYRPYGGFGLGVTPKGPGTSFLTRVMAGIHRDITNPIPGFVGTGGSGGGVLTSWIVGNTDRFAGAVVAKPVINWYSFALTSDAYAFFYKYWFPGLP